MEGLRTSEREALRGGGGGEVAEDEYVLQLHADVEGTACDFDRVVAGLSGDRCGGDARVEPGFGRGEADGLAVDGDFVKLRHFDGEAQGLGVDTFFDAEAEGGGEAGVFVEVVAVEDGLFELDGVVPGGAFEAVMLPDGPVGFPGVDVFEGFASGFEVAVVEDCLLYTSPSPRD